MIDPENMRMILEEEIHKTVKRVTEGLLGSEYDAHTPVRITEFVDDIIEYVYGVESSSIEELYPDMDQFPAEE